MNFFVLKTEDQAQYDALLAGFMDEYQPSTLTEKILVEQMAQHLWLSRRGQRLADDSMENEKQLAFFLRYQSTHERGFHKCLNQLLKLRAEKRKQRMDEAALSQRAEDSRKAFESQKRKEAEETRKQELHEAKVRLTNAKAADIEFETELRSYIEAPLPGNIQISFDEVKGALKYALTEVARNLQTKKAA